jgi:parallel beta-helix repeat protein
MSLRHVLHLMLLWMLLQASYAWSATYYVAASGGNDGRSCFTAQTLSTPRLTINAGIACLAAGDTLYIRQGNYPETVSIIDVVGTASQPITIAGFPGDARPMIMPPSSTGISISTVNSPALETYIILKDLGIDAINQAADEHGIIFWTAHNTADNLYLINVARNGIEIFTDASIVRNSQIINCGRNSADTTDTKGHGFLVTGQDPYFSGSDNLIENNIVDGCRGGGGTTQYGAAAQNNIVRNNIIRNLGTFSPWPWPGGSHAPTTSSGWNIGGTQLNVQFYNNIIYNLGGMPPPGQGASCVYVFASPNPNVIYNNTCYNTDTGIWLDTGAGHIVRNNLLAGQFEALHDNTGGNIASNNLLNPDVSLTFVNAGANNFHLIAGSPAINQGMTIPIVTTDFDGVPRPQPPGGAYDIGAYEFGAAPSGATQVVVTVQPANVAMNTNMASWTVEARDASNVIDTTFNGPVSFALSNNPGLGALTGTVSGNFVNGVKVWCCGNQVTQPGVGYTFAVSATGLTGVTTSPFTVTGPADITRNLVAYYKFNDGAGTATDSSGNVQTGTLVGSPTYGTGAPSLGGGLLFNGTTQSVSVPDSNLLDFTGPYTLAAWVNPSSALTTFAAAIMKNTVYFLYPGATNCGAGSIVGGHGSTFACQSTPLASSTWTHLAVTYDGATVTLWRNGTSVATVSTAVPPVASTGTLELGKSQQGAGEFFPGTLDEVRLYGRSLTPTDITALVAFTDIAPLAPIILRLGVVK